MKPMSMPCLWVYCGCCYDTVVTMLLVECTMTRDRMEGEWGGGGGYE